ncbi:MAG TPA: hypothetical protein DD435_14175 [Cyanobacteria bacterium UBA8530]|nr:hypothetical protein [Cyanobacteria bacterium UBA8530]
MIHVFGAINLDLIAKSDCFAPNTSTPSEISLSLGGVGFNVYRAIRTREKRFVTALGEGMAADLVRGQLSEDIAFLKKVPGIDCGVYLAFMEKGNLLLGAASTRAFEIGLNEETLDEALLSVKKGDLAVLEANILPGPLSHLLERLSLLEVPVLFETVSCEKAARSSACLRDLKLVTPTFEEMEALLAPLSPTDENIFSFLKERNIENLVVTLGKQGSIWYRAEGKREIKPHRVLSLPDSTGAGDYFLAMLATGLSEESRSFESVLYSAVAEVEVFLSARS